jgi:hypothetical protein
LTVSSSQLAPVIFRVPRERYPGFREGERGWNDTSVAYSRCDTACSSQHRSLLLDLAFCFKAHVPQNCHAAAYTSINPAPLYCLSASHRRHYGLSEKAIEYHCLGGCMRQAWAHALQLNHCLISTLCRPAKNTRHTRGNLNFRAALCPHFDSHHHRKVHRHDFTRGIHVIPPWG